ncbi:Sorbicillinoid biosynthetic cluster transcription factor sor3 [Colletotrichum aenigma]|uniref:Sorbicillinoid biosynthetic cluster transcription factor sor3 n=1 Tax=Colletotrichum aenigma TaxID=1215731 RepID=UPI0018733BF4|nr:Sorbicillinoid biosynthetic cluster transcription factor sor3 [Colletotrichum aenigma]KAF5528159.1 Sorbicillinoid biosynthetic cluster transcription factor sor3 [Colletotrichum aenigma]
MSSVQVPPRKRRKTQLACNPCRARKSGCDGTRPVCTACQKKGMQQQCTYQESVLHTSSRPTISELQKRLERLEGSPLPQTSVPLSGSPPLPDSGASGVSGIAPARPIGAGVETGLGDTGSGLQPRVVEGMPASHHQRNGSASHNEDETIYGPSSNISFLRQVTLAADAQKPDDSGPNGPGNETESTPNVLGFSTVQPKSPDPFPEPVMLPERWLADSLMESFWEFVHPVFPILYKPSFIASYEALWKPTKDRNHKRDFKDVVFHSTLSIVLALGSQRTDQVSVAEQANLADKFYKQSVKLISVDTLDHSSLQVVQLLLLRGVYLHYTSYADRCWNTVGVAVRVAQGLGLQNEGDKTVGVNQLKREMRRRVWHCCLTLDRLTATTFGRSVLLSRQYSTPAPAIIDDEYLSEITEGSQVVGRPSYLACFVHSLALFDVLKEILAKFYAEGDCSSDLKSRSLSDVLRLSAKLDELNDSFPVYLREGASLSQYDESLKGSLQMQANILKSRVLWIRLLLLRPLLLVEAKQTAQSSRDLPNSSALSESFGHAANTLCVSTAHGVLQEMYEKLGSVRQNSAWHVLLFTFAAASTLAVATLCPDLRVSFDTEPTKTSWDRALRIFDFHKKHVTSATRGIEVLQRFRNSVAAVSRQDAPAGSNATVSQTSQPEGLQEQNQGDLLLPFSSMPGMSQTPMAQDFGDFLSSDLLNESWFNMQGIDFSNWSSFQ